MSGFFYWDSEIKNLNLCKLHIQLSRSNKKLTALSINISPLEVSPNVLLMQHQQRHKLMVLTNYYT